jgi:pyruvate dehydrogenase E2 component (dihydrolipoamide acetyltransferase)
MLQPITMPALSDTMNNGRLIKWLKQAGDAVANGDAVAEVETDKAVMEVEAFHDGYLAGPLAATNAELPVGQTIGFIADTVEEASCGTVAASPAAPLASPSVTPSPVPTTGMPEAIAAATSPVLEPAVAAAKAFEGQSPRARARARHAAAEAAESRRATVDDAGSRTAPGVASGAQVQDADIAAGPPFRVERPSSLRETVARNVSASAATPTFHVTALLSLEPLITLARSENLSLTVLLARACAHAITAHPLFNAAFTPIGLAHRDRIDIGIATDSIDGLITPVLRDVAGHAVSVLSNDWSALLEKVKSRRLVPTDYRGGTFYLSNLGTFPVVHSFDSIVPAGAAAILSVASNRPDGAFFTLNCDHRVVFGGDAARFLQTLGKHLSNPSTLIDKDQEQ